VSDGVQYLTLEEINVLCDLLGGLKIRDLGLLDSALHRPQSGFGGFEAYATIELKAAALLHSTAKNHALFDGNKRLAWMACDVFLARHGLTSGLSQEEAIAFMLAVAGSDDGMVVEDVAEGLRIVADVGFRKVR
jgi:death on curing protein